jgi:uncharacterized protein (TIGR02302 family)
MHDAETRPARPPASPEGLTRRLRLARAALLWERAWPALWPGLGVIGLFLALALFDLPARLPGPGHAALLLVFAVVLGVALFRALAQFRLPDREAARRRIETASGLEHRPLAALNDRLASGAGDPETAALWQAHRARMAAAAQRLRVGPPAAGLLRRDPYALRAVLALALLIGAVDAGGDWSDRILRSLTPSIGPIGAAVPVGLDVWVTPPDYTGLPPQFLPVATPTQPIAVPVGSGLLAQVHGGYGIPRLVLDEHAADFSRIDESNFKGAAVIKTGHHLSIVQDGRTLGAWPITVVPDLPPTITFAKPPQHTAQGALKLEYRAADDYGVEGVKAIVRRKGDASGETLTFDLPLPGQHLKEASAASYHDLTPHPWAGLPVEITLQAADALGQTGKSETIETVLPERVFHHPIARAIIEARKDLTLHPNDQQPVAETLSDLSRRPGLFGNDIVAFLALRTAQARLMMSREDATVPAVQQLLWQTALRIEEGRAPLNQQDLRQAMKALQDALARNAPEAEIERLMRQLQAAMDRYLQALAENMQRQDMQNMQTVDPSRMLTRQDLQNMLDRMRDLARTGARDQARDLLSQLQQMLENLRMARPTQMPNGQSQSTQAMQQMMRMQQQLLDRSFNRSRQPSGSNGDDQSDAAQQDALRRMLGEMTQHMGEQGGEIPAPLARADRAMRDATGALKRGQPGQAVGPQTEALDALQQAARAMANQMLGRNGMMPRGGDPGDREGLNQADRDPFGRLTNEENGNGGLDDGGEMRMGKSQSDYALEKAKQILDELRTRAGERSRPEIERDYIDRLLRQF